MRSLLLHPHRSGGHVLQDEARRHRHASNEATAGGVMATHGGRGRQRITTETSIA